MDRTFIMFIAIGVVFMFLVMRFVDTLQEKTGGEPSSYAASSKEELYIEDESVGGLVLDVTDKSSDKQLRAWQNSDLRNEMMEYFPRIDEMKTFVQLHVKGEPLRTKLLEHIDEVNDALVSGEISYDEAKKRLLTLDKL